MPEFGCNIVSKQEIEELWDMIAQKLDFQEPEIRLIDVDGIPFRALLLPRSKDFGPKVYLKTGLSFFAWPRIAGYRYRWVLIPADNLADNSREKRWTPTIEDITDWIRWSNTMEHNVSLSTFKSGAGVPWGIHAQSIPLFLEKGEERIKLTSLQDVEPETIIETGQMPWFKDIRISVLKGYPARGLKIEGSDSADSLEQCARKTWETALNYDNFKAFNLVILPSPGQASQVYFFPRRRDGVATWGKDRWQIAGMEMSGMMPGKSNEGFRSIDPETIKQVFRRTCLDDQEFRDFLKLLETF
jgi:hypothetical protein